MSCVCSLCLRCVSPADLDHVDLGCNGAIPVCLPCIAELAEQCDERRERWIEAVEASEWPEGSELPWQYDATPANDTCDVGEAA